MGEGTVDNTHPTPLWGVTGRPRRRTGTPDTLTTNGCITCEFTEVAGSDSERVEGRMSPDASVDVPTPGKKGVVGTGALESGKS